MQTRIQMKRIIRIGNQQKQRDEKVWIMMAFMASLLFAAAFIGSLTVIFAMLQGRWETILIALAGHHVSVHPQRQAPMVIRVSRDRQRTTRVMASPSGFTQLHRPAVAA